MKLCYTDTSPFARKNRITLIEKGLSNQVEEILSSPFVENPELIASNPLNKVPVLITHDGEAIYDSAVISAYLDSLAPEPRLIPPGADQFKVRVNEALADGIMEAAFSMTMERNRTEAEQSVHWLERWEKAIRSALSHIERNIKAFEGELTIAQIALVSALSYLDLRHDYLDWRTSYPLTNAWMAEFSQRPSVIATSPQSG